MTVPAGWCGDVGRVPGSGGAGGCRGPVVGLTLDMAGQGPEARVMIQGAGGARAGPSSARWEWAMAVMPPPCLVPTDNLHHNYLHLNVNSPKHHATTLGTCQGRAGDTGPLSSAPESTPGGPGTEQVGGP